MKTEIARVKKGKNNIEIAKALHKALGHSCNIGEIVKMLRLYESEGLVVRTENEVIMYHIY